MQICKLILKIGFVYEAARPKWFAAFFMDEMVNEVDKKVRKGFYIEEELLEQADELLEQANVKSRNEFLNQALKFYIGYLSSAKIENYMLSTISSVMHATVKDSENRMARAIFKLAVEISKLSNVVAYSHCVDEDTLWKLQTKCVEEVD